MIEILRYKTCNSINTLKSNLIVSHMNLHSSRKPRKQIYPFARTKVYERKFQKSHPSFTLILCFPFPSLELSPKSKLTTMF